MNKEILKLKMELKIITLDKTIISLTKLVAVAKENFNDESFINMITAEKESKIKEKILLISELKRL